MPGAIQVSHVSSGARRDPARWRPDTMTLPLIPTAVVGSHGKPGWWFAGVKAYDRGEFGPHDPTYEGDLRRAAHLRLTDPPGQGVQGRRGRRRALRRGHQSGAARSRGRGRRVHPDRRARAWQRLRRGDGAPVQPGHGRRRREARVSHLLRQSLRTLTLPADVRAVLPRDLEITGPPVRAGVREPRDGRARPLEDSRRWARARRGCGGREGLRPGHSGGRREAYPQGPQRLPGREAHGDRKSTRLNSSHTVISYAVFCLK